MVAAQRESRLFFKTFLCTASEKSTTVFLAVMTVTQSKTDRVC